MRLTASMIQQNLVDPNTVIGFVKPKLTQAGLPGPVLDAIETLVPELCNLVCVLCSYPTHFARPGLHAMAPFSRGTCNEKFLIIQVI